MRKKKEIDPKRWYIVDLNKKSRSGGYTVFKNYFKTYKECKQAIDISFKDDKIMYDPIRGEKAIEFQFTIKGRLTTGRGHIIKYKYPPEKMTTQQRKSYRTKYRRWRRDFKKQLTSHWA